MKKGFAVLLGMLFVFVMCSSTVFAWDDLINIDRHAKVGDPGDMLGAFGVRYSSAGDMFDGDGDKQSLADNMTELRIPIWGRYNIMENLEVFAILPIVSSDDGTNSESGIGDIWLGAKYSVMPDGMFTVRGALDLPTGDDKKDLGNSGGFGIDVAAMTEKKIDQIGLFGEAGIRYNAEDSDTMWKPGMIYYIQGRASYDVTEMIPAWVSLTYFGEGDGEYDGSEIDKSAWTWLELEVGGSYKLSEALWVAVPIQYSLAGTNSGAGFGIGVFLGYYVGQ